MSLVAQVAEPALSRITAVIDTDSIMHRPNDEQDQSDDPDEVVRRRSGVLQLHDPWRGQGRRGVATPLLGRQGSSSRLRGRRAPRSLAPPRSRDARLSAAAHEGSLMTSSPAAPHQRPEMVSPLLEARVLVEAGTGRRQKHHVTRLRRPGRGPDGALQVPVATAARARPPSPAPAHLGESGRDERRGLPDEIDGPAAAGAGAGHRPVVGGLVAPTQDEMSPSG